MTLGNELYLAMVVGVFVVFTAVLAYQTWSQSEPKPKPKPAPARVAHTHPADGVRI
ncbi:MAG TPA: hypothetical protein VH023_18780 [Rhodopila sp.]|nr:hypothetical protein [Rhodopila sp.]